MRRCFGRLRVDVHGVDGVDVMIEWIALGIEDEIDGCG